MEEVKKMILAEAEEKKFYKFVHVEDTKEIKLKLAAMGLSKGALVKVIKNDFFGPIILGKNSTRISLGRNLAQKIEVSLYEKAN
jgi:Fe2+ transport system protein FeoA